MIKYNYTHTIFFLLIICVCIYFDIGGNTKIYTLNLIKKTSDTTTFESKENSIEDNEGHKWWNTYSKEINENAVYINKYFPMYNDAGEFGAFTITSSAMGILGAVSYLLFNIIFRSGNYEWFKLFGMIMLGGLFGLFSFLVVEFSPAVLYTKPSDLIPVSSYSLSFLSGLACEKFYEKFFK